MDRDVYSSSHDVGSSPYFLLVSLWFYTSSTMAHVTHELCLDLHTGNPRDFLAKMHASLYLEQELLLPLHEVLDQLYI